jgi:hypothetical protein
LFDELTARPQFSIPQQEKESILQRELEALTQWHSDHSPEYRRMLAANDLPPGTGLAGLPFIPVNIFKQHLLSSVPDAEVFKVMTSSGTTGQQVSRIVLDRETASRQSTALTKIMTHVLGPQRLPMIIVDTPNVVKNRKEFSARGAGVLGMIPYGRKHLYALNDDMELDVDALREFLQKHSGGPILIFGFTFMVWKYFYQRICGLGLDLSNAVLIHSGGWKKLLDEAVDNKEFRSALERDTGMTRIHNFYGMVEQVGSVFMEAADGYLRPPNYADVIVRDPLSWEPLPDGQVGVIQVLSVLPLSYPGHSILTEDLGVVHGVSADGWTGKRLEVIGRVPKTEMRGCSDTHAADVQVARI